MRSPPRGRGARDNTVRGLMTTGYEHSESRATTGCEARATRRVAPGCGWPACIQVWGVGTTSVCGVGTARWSARVLFEGKSHSISLMSDRFETWPPDMGVLGVERPVFHQLVGV